MRQKRNHGRARACKRTAPRAGRESGETDFLRRTFYYLKGEQFLQASRRLLCEAA